MTPLYRSYYRDHQDRLYRDRLAEPRAQPRKFLLREHGMDRLHRARRAEQVLQGPTLDDTDLEEPPDDARRMRSGRQEARRNDGTRSNSRLQEGVDAAEREDAPSHRELQCSGGTLDRDPELERSDDRTHRGMRRIPRTDRPGPPGRTDPPSEPE